MSSPPVLPETDAANGTSAAAAAPSSDRAGRLPENIQDGAIHLNPPRFWIRQRKVCERIFSRARGSRRIATIAPFLFLLILVPVSAQMPFQVKRRILATPTSTPRRDDDTLSLGVRTPPPIPGRFNRQSPTIPPLPPTPHSPSGITAVTTVAPSRASPTPGVSSRHKVSTSIPWNYVIPIGLVVLAIGCLLRWKMKLRATPPTFHAHWDRGGPQKQHENVTINYELHFDPNFAKGRQRLETDEARLITSRKKKT